MKTSPQHRLAVAGLIATLVALAAIYLALQAPMLDIRFASDDQAGLLIESVAPSSPNAQQLSPGMRMSRLGGLDARADWLIEEPDNLERWDDYNRLLDDFRQLTARLADGSIEAVIDERTTTLRVRDRHLADLPPLFWLQLLVGVLSFLIATGVYAFRTDEPGARHFAITGLGLLLSACAAGVYSTRELLIDGSTMQNLSSINWFGTLGFTAALAALMWQYPERSRSRFPLAGLVYLTALLTWIAFVWQLLPVPSTTYFVILALFSSTFVFAWLQWRRTASHPVQRAALKWYLLSIYLGTGLFAAVILIPVALEAPPVASQGVMFLVFLFMFIGIAFGITRYRLFDLDRWWLSAWMWFLGGVSVILLDMLLLWLLGLGHSTTLALSLALVGWVWFPVRQWVFSHLLHRRDDLTGQLQRLVQALFGCDEADQLATVLQQHLSDEWALLELQVSPGRLQRPVIDEDGQALKVPHLTGDQHLILRYPQRGSRLFSAHDRDTVELLYQLARQAMQGLRERHRAREERLRILGDLHDDVGSKLLSLLYRAADADSSELARAALQDLRDVVSQPESGMQELGDALADWRAEAQERLQSSDIRFDWQQTDIGSGEVPVYCLRHTARILREALNNVIRHAGASRVWIRAVQQGERLNLAIIDDGDAGDPDEWREGRGMSNIRHRLDKLSGSGRWRRNEHGGCTLEIDIPLETALESSPENSLENR